MSTKLNIRNFSEEELTDFCLKNKIDRYRAKQINEWIWKKHAISFEEMSSLPKKIRNILIQHFFITHIQIHRKEKSLDNTLKYSFKLEDRLLIEGVLIPSKNRITACVSSQVGCSLDCKFCATGTLKLKRNLKKGEIYDQVYILNKESISNFGKPLSNIVFMGMGEPLLNFKNPVDSIKLITTKLTEMQYLEMATLMIIQ